MKEWIFVLASMVQLGIILYILFFSVQFIRFIFAKNRKNKKNSREDEQNNYRKKAILTAISMAILLIIKYLTY